MAEWRKRVFDSLVLWFFFTLFSTAVFVLKLLRRGDSQDAERIHC